MDDNQNEPRSFKLKFDFFKNRNKGASKEGTQGFKEKMGDFKDTIVMRDSNRKGAHPVITILATIVIVFLVFFITLPALNFMSPEFYSFLIMTVLVYNGLNFLIGKMPVFRTGFVSAIIIGLLIVVPTVLVFFSHPLFRAKAYAQLIPVTDANFGDTVKEISYDKVPVVDREAAAVIGARQMGSVQEVVSQFEINDNYAQINIEGIPVRVTPLSYSDLIKYIINAKNGIPYYVKVDMATQEADLVKLVNPLKYSKSDILMRDVTRHIRFKFPTKIFGETNFEVDDEGNGYYITSVLTKRIGFLRGTDVQGAIVTNGSSGESIFYDVADVPTWVDRVYPSDLIIQQLDFRGKLTGGFINSIIGQKNVTRTTQGYNYVPLNDDIYLFTGVTSIRSDSSNLGFYFVNLRTKEAKFFSVPSADEVSAMNSARGQIQEKNYTPAFPILLNIKDRPIYLIGLKDASGLAKMFALVDAENYQNVIVGNTVQEVMNQYNIRTDTSNKPGADANERSILIEEIQSVVIDGNTHFFIRAKDDPVIYAGTAKTLGPAMAFAKPGDTLKVYGNPRGDQFDILEIRD
ncbi:hypothetical protein J0B03_12160 [Alkalibacter rhizosphaerae]|uniref:Cell shape-determining protein n=1 Tax=Alkalibacter rhizosphaerae TaxID=2815577 RepID=A0A975AIG9_9FIRM|nr:hypothetical protein [Alkalibacter rhizosphaerae]QSX08515.1 hypothetical protein J0B03_12160 [Alkalibacter rhizosphaerae]